MKTSVPPPVLKPGKIAANAAAGVAATGIYLVSRLLLTPLVLSHISLPEFGLWSMCFVILSYASMGAFGVNTTYIRFTAISHSRGSTKDISRLLSTGVFSMFIFCTLFWLVLYLAMPLMLDAFHIETGMRKTSAAMILGTAAVFSIDLIFGGFRSVLEGIQEIALVRKINTVSALAEIGFIVLFLGLGTGVQGLLYAYLARILMETSACFLAARRMLPCLGLSPGLVNREHARHLFVFGGKVQVLGGMAMFFSALDRMVISAMLGLSAAGMFEVGRKLPFTAKSVSSAAFGPFLPAAASLRVQPTDHPPPFRAILRNWLGVVVLALCAAVIPLAWIPSWLDLPAGAAWVMTLSGAAGLFLTLRLLAPRSGSGQAPEVSLQRLYLNGLRHINLINATIFAFLAAGAPILITAWLGEGYGNAAGIMQLLAAGYMIQQSTGPVTLILRGIDRCSLELEYLMMQLVLAITWIPAGTAAWGLPGAAAAIALGNLASAGYLFWCSSRMFHIRVAASVRHTLVPTLIPLALAAAVHLACGLHQEPPRMEAVVYVMGLGLVYLSLVAVLVWGLVLTRDEKQLLRSLNTFQGKEKQPC